MSCEYGNLDTCGSFECTDQCDFYGVNGSCDESCFKFYNCSYCLSPKRVDICTKEDNCWCKSLNGRCELNIDMPCSFKKTIDNK